MSETIEDYDQTVKPVWTQYVVHAGLAVVVLAILAVAALMSQPTVIAGIAVANPQAVIAAAADRKAAEEAQQAQEAAAYLAAVEEQTTTSMQNYFDDPAEGLTGFDVHVYGVQLIEVGPNKFEGMADMQAGSGPRRQIQVHVTADQKTIMWNTDQGALLPLLG